MFLITPLLSFIDDCWFWYEAESTHRAGGIENAFGIEITNLNTEEYYNNRQQPSIKKYQLNTFENIFLENLFLKKCYYQKG